MLKRQQTTNVLVCGIRFVKLYIMYEKKMVVYAMDTICDTYIFKKYTTMNHLNKKVPLTKSYR